MLKHDRLTVESDVNFLTQVLAWFEEFCLQHVSHQNWSDKQLYCLKLAIAEGFTNAVRHAHHKLPPETPIVIEIGVWLDRIEIRLWDYGEPFNPDLVKEPEPGTLCEGGYGWFLLRRLSDRVVYERCSDGRNCLLIVKNRLEEVKLSEK